MLCKLLFLRKPNFKMFILFVENLEKISKAKKNWKYPKISIVIKKTGIFQGFEKNLENIE